MKPGEMPEKMALNVSRRADEVTMGNDSEQTTLESLSEGRSRLQMPRGIADPMLRSSTRTRYIGAGVLVALLAGLVTVFIRSQPPDLQFARAATGTIAVSFTTAGTLQSASYDINFAAAGKVAEIDVQGGQKVTEGQTLAKLDTTVLPDATKDAQVGADAAQSALSNAQTTQSKVQAKTQAELTPGCKQAQVGIPKCAASDTDCVQRAEDDYAAAQARADAENAAAAAAVDAAQSQLSVAQAGLQTAQDNLTNAVLTAPHDGTVDVIFGTIGSTTGGANATTPFIRLVDLDTLQIVANVSANDIGAVAPQQPVRFSVPTFADQTSQGAVYTVAPVGQ